VLAPLKTAKRSLLKAVLKPLVIAVAVLVVLVAIKLLIFAMVRTIRDAAFEDVPPPLEVERDRQHGDEGDGDDAAGAHGADDAEAKVTSPQQ
jgi:flagellar biosynthesis/type III secretory pathway M-ring protein FliF/YscJ